MSFPLSVVQAVIDQAVAESGGAFQPFRDGYYTSVNAASLAAYYAQPANQGKSLLQHFVEIGGLGGFSPSPYFDPVFYGTRWPDLAGLSNVDRFVHWIKFGMSEGRAAVAEFNSFNAARYLADFPDVAAYVNAHLDSFLGSVTNGALAHFVKFGSAEQRVAYTTGDGAVILPKTDDASVIRTAKDTGGVLPGIDAVVVAIPRDGTNAVLANTKLGNNVQGATIPSAVLSSTLYHAVNGDDQLFGGNGNDNIVAGTGDDTIFASRGNDTIDGGGNSIAPNGEKISYVDTLIFRENDFGAGSKFVVTPDATFATTGKGEATILDAQGAVIGTIKFSGIEDVRTLSNSGGDSLDFSALSNAAAAATGESANLDQTPMADAGAVSGTLDLAQGTNYNEGALLRLTATDAGLAFAVDRNGDDDTSDPGEVTVSTLQVLGVENVKGGAANDIVIMDKSQAGSVNTIDLAGQQPDLTPNGKYTEGRDMVVYDHSSLSDVLRPTVTVRVETKANTDSVALAGGALAAFIANDTLIDVEVLDISAAATSRLAADALDLSKMAGATVNFGAGAIAVGRSLGGQVSPVNSVEATEANTFEDGGVTAGGTNLGNETLEIIGITQLERVKGSAGDDRIVLGDGTAISNPGFNAAVTLADDRVFDLEFAANYKIATRSYDTTQLVDNLAFYQFDLGDGANDALDYRKSNDAIAVVLDFDGADDYVVVNQNDAAGETLAASDWFGDGTKDRVDLARNVERYWGAQNQGADNVIDLSRASAAVTITFGAESKAAGAEYVDPNGVDTAQGSATEDLVTGINVSTAATASVGRFMQASANAATGTAQALWERIEGSNQDETVLFSAYQDRLASEVLNLRGGANTVSYATAVRNGMADTYTLAIAEFDASSKLATTTTAPAYTVTHFSADSVGTGIDTITIDRQISATNTNTDGTLTLIGSSNSSDVVSIAGFATAPTGLDKPGSDDILGDKFSAGLAPGEEAFIVDISGTVKGGYNLIDLGQGGRVVQDVNLELKGSKAVADNVATAISGWENATGSIFNDRLYGDAGPNVLTGGGGNDVFQGKGGGDTLHLGAGNDRVVYTGPSDTADVLGDTVAQAGSFDAVKSFDAAGNDHIALDLTGTAGTGGFSLSSYRVQEQVAVGGINPTMGGIIVIAADNVVAAADALDMTKVVTGLGASATLTTGVAAGTQMLFALDTTDKVGLYLWTAGTLGDTSVQANELRLLAQIDNADIGLVAAESDVVFTAADLAVRSLAGGQNSADVILSNTGTRDEFVYFSGNQSTFTQMDTIGRDVLGSITNGFESGVDKIDLSAFNLGAANGLAINSIIVREYAGGGMQLNHLAMTNFFVDAGGVRRSVVVEFDNNDSDLVSPGVQAHAYVMVDVNGNGQFDTSGDLLIDLLTDGGYAPTPGNDTGPGFLGSYVPAYQDFIFVV